MNDIATAPSGAATDVAPSNPVETTGKPVDVSRDERGRFASKEAETTTAGPLAETAETNEKAETEVADEGASQVNDESPKEKEARRKSAKDRINEITAQKYQALNEAGSLRLRVAQLEKQLAEMPSDPNDFSADMRRAVKTENIEQSRVAAQAAEDAAMRAMANEFNAKIAIARDTMPNLDRVLPVFGSIPLSNAACDTIASSDKAAEIAYYLGQNPQEGHRIAAMPVYRQTAELVRLESRLTAPKPKTVSAAPRPATTLGGSASPKADDLSSMPMEKFHALMTKHR